MSSSGAPSAKPDRAISLLAFAFMEYERRSWDMPDVHVRIYEWLERTDSKRVRVLRVFRGCGKSTVLGVRNAHKYLQNPLHQLLVQGADDDLTYDISRDTVAVLSAHPLTQGVLREPAAVKQWWTLAGWKNTRRTPSFRGRGILSRVTGNRADEIQNDDVEVEKNVENDKARKKLRKKLTEQTHILKPGGSRLYVGTPHAHDSLYDQLIKGGADHLTIPLFATQARYETQPDRQKVFPIKGVPDSDGVWVFVGIGDLAWLAKEGEHYVIDGGRVVFVKPPGATVDVCTGNAWPERFHREEMELRRKECKTFNEWDSQYQLEAKPVGETRLDPDRLKVYDVEPTIRTHNGQPVMYLGKARIVSATAHWDPAGNKLNSDTSAFCLMLQDETGRPYWHRAIALEGEVAELNDDGKVVGGQVMQICDLVKELAIPRVTIETNGVGTHAPGLLRGALKARRIPCGVSDQHTTANKARKILGAFDSPLSSGYLWAHVSVLEAVEEQMRSWNPAATNQPDDFLDAGAECLIQQPERIGRGPKVGNADPHERDDWRPSAGTFEIEVDQVV